MGKKIEDPMKGLYRQKLRWWFRYSHGGKQVAHNCKTRDVSEALEVKRKVLAAIAKGGAAAMPSSAKSWEQHINDYLDEKRAKGELRKGTTKGVKSVLKLFQESSKIKRPEEATYSDLEKFFKESRLKSNSTAKTYLATVQAFLNDLGLLHKRFYLPKTVKVASRKTIEEMDVINQWIEKCPRPELKYVLFCLGHLGMRAGEVKFSKVDWFDSEFCNIPTRMSHRLKNGQKEEWLPKDSEDRSIPLTTEMKAWLPTFLSGRKGLVIQSKKSKTRVWEFRLPLKKYLTDVGRKDFYPHAFRHSWITYLMNNGYDITDVATWSGDTLETLQKHYWHKKKKPGALDVSGRKVIQPGEQRILDELKRLEAKINLQVETKQKMAAIDGIELSRPWALLAIEQDGEIKDPELLQALRKAIGDIPEEDTVAHQLSLMTPRQRKAFYKKNDINPNEPIFEVFWAEDVE